MTDHTNCYPVMVVDESESRILISEYISGYGLNHRTEKINPNICLYYPEIKKIENIRGSFYNINCGNSSIYSSYKILYKIKPPYEVGYVYDNISNKWHAIGLLNFYDPDRKQFNVQVRENVYSYWNYFESIKKREV